LATDLAHRPNPLRVPTHWQRRSKGIHDIPHRITKRRIDVFPDEPPDLLIEAIKSSAVGHRDERDGATRSKAVVERTSHALH
jgi:hypothetical protein